MHRIESVEPEGAPAARPERDPSGGRCGGRMAEESGSALSCPLDAAHRTLHHRLRLVMIIGVSRAAGRRHRAAVDRRVGASSYVQGRASRVRAVAADEATSVVRRCRRSRSRAGCRRSGNRRCMARRRFFHFGATRLPLSVGPLFCIIDGPTLGGSWSSAGVQVEFRRLVAQGACDGASRRISCACARRRARPRRRATQRHPRPARAREPRHHQHLSARHRHRRDHRHGARPAGADDVGHRRTPALTNTR
jgi:hypothetical protein